MIKRNFLSRIEIDKKIENYCFFNEKKTFVRMTKRKKSSDRLFVVVYNDDYNTCEMCLK